MVFYFVCSVNRAFTMFVVIFRWLVLQWRAKIYKHIQRLAPSFFILSWTTSINFVSQLSTTFVQNISKKGRYVIFPPRFQNLLKMSFYCWRTLTGVSHHIHVGLRKTRGMDVSPMLVRWWQHVQVSNYSYNWPMYGLSRYYIDHNTWKCIPSEIAPHQEIRRIFIYIYFGLQLVRQKYFHRCSVLVHAVMQICSVLTTSTCSLTDCLKVECCDRFCTQLGVPPYGNINSATSLPVAFFIPLAWRAYTSPLQPSFRHVCAQNIFQLHP